MKSKIAVTIACLFLFSVTLMCYAEADEEITPPKPPIAPKEPTVVETKVRKEKVEKNKEKDLLQNLEEQMEKFEGKYKASPKGSEESQNFMERMKAIRKRMAEIRAKSQKARRKKRPRTPTPAATQEQIKQKRKEIKELEDKLAKARQHISEIKEKMDEDADLPPEVKTIERRIRYLQRTLDYDKALLKRMLVKQKQLAPKERRPQPARSTRRVQRSPDWRLEIFPIAHVSVAYLADLIQPFLTQEVGVVVHCIHTNSIIVRDKENVLKQIAKIVKHVDVPKKEVDERKKK